MPQENEGGGQFPWLVCNHMIPLDAESQMALQTQGDSASPSSLSWTSRWSEHSTPELTRGEELALQSFQPKPAKRTLEAQQSLVLESLARNTPLPCPRQSWPPWRQGLEAGLWEARDGMSGLRLMTKDLSSPRRRGLEARSHFLESRGVVNHSQLPPAK